MTIKTAMLLSAGKGERLQPLTLTTPKPLLPIHGKPFIVHHIEKLAALGVERIVINVCYLADKIINTLGDGNNFGLEIVYSCEEIPLGPGGGIQKALPLLGNQHFLLISSDVYTDYNFEKLVQQAWQPQQLAHAVLTEKHCYDKGDFNLIHGKLTLAEKPQYIYGSIAVINPTLFQNVQPGFASLMPAFSNAIQQQAASGEYYQNILNINTLEEYQQQA